MTEFIVPSERYIYLITDEGDKFNVNLKSALMSELVKTMFDPELPEDEEQEFTIPNIKTEILVKIIDFITYYQENPMTEIEKPLKSSNMNEIVSEWYVNFVNVEQDILFEILNAANFMDIKPLLDLCCATVASMIKGKTPEEIRQHFRIVNDFTPEEETKIREENKWCENI